MSRNLKVKLTKEDKFARRFYCQGAKTRLIRAEKHYNNKKMRRINKDECMKGDY